MNVSLLLVLLLGGSCQAALDGATRERLYDRTHAVFAAAQLRKPAAMQANERIQALAPLLLQEVEPKESQRPAGPSTVYYLESSIELGGRVHDSITYVWDDAEALQGLRLTLDVDDFPLTYEVLRDSSGARLVFVSSSLEQSASAELGAPAPGRRFSIENRVDATPNVIVPSALEPGPVPLGPFVYLQLGTGDVATMICRCSSSQVEVVLTSEEYRLEPLDGTHRAEREPRLRQLLPDAPLKHLLRLPRELHPATAHREAGAVE